MFLINRHKQNIKIQIHEKPKKIFYNNNELSGQIWGNKKANLLTNNKLAFILVSPIGFEPMATSLEGRCSIQLSYGPKSLFYKDIKKKGG